MDRRLLLLLCAGCLESIEVGEQSDSGPRPPPGSIDGGGDGSGCMTDFRNRVIVEPPVGDARFFEIRGIGFDASRNLYVLSREGPPYQGHITKLGPAPTHELINSYGRNDLDFVRDLAVAADGTTYVTNWYEAGDTPEVFSFTPAGALSTRFETTEPNMVNDQALGIAVDDQDTLYIGGLVLFRYRTDGTFVDYFGVEGPNPGEVLLPIGLAWDPQGFLWVADLFRNHIHQYDLATRAQRIEFGGRGNELGTFDGTAPEGEYWGPTRIALDRQGNVYVNDPWSSRLQKFDRFGGSLGEFSFGGSRELDGALAIEPMSGNIYVARGDTIDIVCPF